MLIKEGVCQKPFVIDFVMLSVVEAFGLIEESSLIYSVW